MNALIARLEAATGPDRKLDAEIAVAIRCPTNHKGNPIPSWALENFPRWRAGEYGRVEVVHSDGSGGAHWAAPRFMASLDAALTAVPEGWVRDVDATLPSAGITVRLHCPARQAWPTYYVGDHMVEAIATCIAALKAREVQDG